MTNVEWNDLHGDYTGEDNGETVTMQAEIELPEGVLYKCLATVNLYNGMPIDADVFEMVREEYSVISGNKIETIDLTYNEFPQEIKRAAERKLIEDWV